MPRIAGVDIPNEKQVRYSLAYIYGVGARNAVDILEGAGVEPTKRAKDLTSDEITKIIAQLALIKVEGDLRREVQMNIKRHMDVGSYRGLRHRKRLPCRGQRTRTNARTRKGKRGQPITGKKAATKT